jgi:hypothetical protein
VGFGGILDVAGLDLIQLNKDPTFDGLISCRFMGFLLCWPLPGWTRRDQIKCRTFRAQHESEF